MRRTFRLATVERLRATRLEEAGTALQRAADAREAAVALRDRLTRALVAPAPSGDGAGLVTGAAHRERLREERVRAAEQVDRCDEALAAARADWLEARAQLKAVQSLHDAHRRALAEQVARAEQRELDEIAGIRACRAVLDGGAA